MEGEYKDEYKEKLELRELPKSEGKSFLHVNCPSCDDKVDASNINIHDKVAKCGNCSALFSIVSDMEMLLAQESREEIARPDGVEIMHFQDEMELVIQQPPSVLNIIIISIFPFLAGLGLFAFFLKGGVRGLAVGLPSLVVSIYGILALVQAKRNKIYISVDQNNIKIEWRPRHLIRDKSFSVEDVEQLYVKKTSDGVALFMAYNTVTGQKHRQIMGRISSIVRAKYLEQEIEKYLGIPNKKVMGEL